MSEQLVFVGAVLVAGVVFALVFGGVLLFFSVCFPAEEGNRPAPPHVVADREQARLTTLQRIAARQRGSL